MGDLEAGALKLTVDDAAASYFASPKSRIMAVKSTTVKERTGTVGAGVCWRQKAKASSVRFTLRVQCSCCCCQERVGKGREMV